MACYLYFTTSGEKIYINVTRKLSKITGYRHLSNVYKLANKEINVSQKGLDTVKNHISNNGFDAPENSMMINRIENSMNNGEKLTGADASYYMHELKESTLMKQGMSYDDAHISALQTYEVSPFSVYHPEVIQQNQSAWGKPWFNFWGIQK